MSRFIHAMSDGGFQASLVIGLCICQVMMLLTTILFSRVFNDLRETLNVIEASLPDEARDTVP